MICERCDIEGPIIPGPWLTSYELLDFHRALHKLRRTITQEIAKRLPALPHDDEQ